MDRITLFIVFSLLWAPLIRGAQPVPPDIDFTAGQVPEGNMAQAHDWTLGPTGARGWVWSWREHTTRARQIRVTRVFPGSPADGILEKDDVILGVFGKPFDSDARIAFGTAITEAEKETGSLELIRWRNGKRENVVIKIPVLGSYAPTAPYNCPKSARILERGCKAIAEKGFRNKKGNLTISIENDLNALALLASKKEQYLPLVREYAAFVADSTPGGYPSWSYSYAVLFLGEYCYATGDKTVLPGLTRLTTDIARGQSRVGTWGHRFRPVGSFTLEGYGAMNQPGIILTLAMLTAREAGVQSPDVDQAIALSERFLRWYVGKGAIPYGDHTPWGEHEDNGKCASATVMFDLLDNRDGAAFFRRMALAGYEERECGHTGDFFCILWSMLGVARCGESAAGAYFDKTAWYYDLGRTYNGLVEHQEMPGSTQSYTGWDSTGAYMLTYALPLKSLLITGKKPFSVSPLDKTAIYQTIEDGRWSFIDGLERFYEPLSCSQLIDKLGSWSPTVRNRAGQELALKIKKLDEQEAKPYINRIISQLDSKDSDTRCGACVALKHLGNRGELAAPKLRAKLADAPLWEAALAADALLAMSEPVREQSVPALLGLVVRPTQPDDPRRRFLSLFSDALFRRGANNLVRNAMNKATGQERQLVFRAVRELLYSEDGRIRSAVAALYPHLNDADVAELLPDIYQTTKVPAPSGEMFAYGIRMAGLELLAKRGIREGMDLCIEILGEARWGRDFDKTGEILLLYGKNAVAYREVIDTQIRKAIHKDDLGRTNEKLDRLLKKLDEAKSDVPLVTLEEFVRQHKER